ncbi:MAG: MBOAT family protein [Lachnospiraceae bacterium]|nr:MBOAT family protein [Lachnospiraceae bacterium]
MLFTSYLFLGFLALVLILYYVLPKRAQWPLLLIASYVFYFAAGAHFLLYMFSTTVTIWGAAVLIDKNHAAQKAYLKEHKEGMDREALKAYRSSQKKIRFRYFLAALLVNLLVLAVVKYANFFIDNVNGVLKAFGSGEGLSFVNIALPMGISFYTFQAIGYLVDVYRGNTPAEKSLPRFALFVSFFPQVVQGPINRFGEMAPTLYAPHGFDGRQVSFGLQRVLWGYFKKMVIADRILVAVTAIFGDPSHQGAYVFVGMIFYRLQLYADFSGGIDITIGIAEALGISLRENFNRPYFSKSLPEYWRRWHMSMNAWFRDYIFYPLSTSPALVALTKAVRKRFGAGAGKRVPLYISSFAAWAATGIWHGASWNFVVWGLTNWFILMLSEELTPLYARFRKMTHTEHKRSYDVFQIGRTFLLIGCVNLFDCHATLGSTFRSFASMFTMNNYHIIGDGSLLQLGLSGLDYVILAGAWLLVLAVSLVQRKGSVRAQIEPLPYAVKYVMFFGLFLIVLLMGAYGVGYDQSQFIYNRF